MNTTEKKILFPTLYPASRDMAAMWFIKYKVEDFDTGTFKSRKYYGALNLIADKDERIKKGEEYIAMMLRGEDLPSYQGMKRLIAEHPRTFANTAACCHKWLNARRNELDKLTISQYKSRINFFAAWLKEKDLHKLAIGGITKDHARAFLNYLKDEKKYANKTYNDYKALFGTIWEEYEDEGKIKQNPWRKISTLPSETKHFEDYPPKLRHFIRETLPEYDPQLWLFMQTIYYCGIRPGCELRFMKVKDFMVQKHRFIVRKEIAKGPKKKKRQRIINIYNGLFEQYIEKGYHEYPREYFLFTREGCPGEKHVRHDYFSDRWNAYKKEYGIPDIYKLYGSKHTAGKLLSLLFNTYTTKEHYGHRSEDSTRQYTEDVSKDELTFLQTKFPEF